MGDLKLNISEIRLDGNNPEFLTLEKCLIIIGIAYQFQNNFPGSKTYEFMDIVI